MTRVTIAILTCRRPAGLLRALASVDLQEAPPDTDVQVLVVDNQIEGEGARACEGRAIEARWPVHSCIEVRPGIAVARNRALADAGNSDVIVFLDDDEEAEPGWLAELIRAHRVHGADIVAGFTARALPAGAPEWLADEGLLGDVDPGEDGAAIELGFTGNLLIARRVWDELGLSFDERFTLTGGEDTDFSLRARRLGARIVAAPSARAREFVPPERCRARWLLRRQMRAAATGVISEVSLDGWWRRAPWHLARAAAHLAWSLPRLVTRIRQPRRALVCAAAELATTAGIILGLTGHAPREYGRGTAD